MKSLCSFCSSMERGGYQNWVHGSAQGLAVKLMTISFTGGGRSMRDWAGGAAEVKCKSHSLGNREQW